MEKNLINKLKDKITTFFAEDQGIVAIIAGLIIVVVIGFAALAIDASIWYSEKRKLQLAADAGAIGGAIALQVTGQSTMTSYATNDINLNNCTGATNCTIVAINNPPASGPYAGNTKDVEVILTQPANTFLSGLFLSSPTLHVRAVAGSTPTNNCIVALTNSGIGINVKGGGSILSPNCAVYSNSSASNSINVVGTGSITTSNVTAVGGTSGGGTISASNGITTGAPPIADPYAGVTMPTPSPVCLPANTNYTLNNVSGTINPGTFCGGITLKSAANLTMNPGVYFLVQSGAGPSAAGNFTASSQATITGNGVTIVMTTIPGTGSTNYGTVSFPAQITANMSAPTTGTTAGILFFGDRNSSGLTEKVDGGTSQVLSGALYFPTNDLDYNGQAGIVRNPCFQLVANTLTLTGGAALGNNCPSIPGIGTIKLLE